MNENRQIVRKLFFDDMREAPGLDWTVVRDVPAAKAIMSQFSFDVMSLDHDMGSILCEACQDEARAKRVVILDESVALGCGHVESGTNLAEWMADNLGKNVEWPRLIVLHTANRWGAQKMKNILSPFTRVEYVPYPLADYKRLIATRIHQSNSADTT